MVDGHCVPSKVVESLEYEVGTCLKPGFGAISLLIAPHGQSNPKIVLSTADIVAIVICAVFAILIILVLILLVRRTRQTNVLDTFLGREDSDDDDVMIIGYQNSNIRIGAENRDAIDNEDL